MTLTHKRKAELAKMTLPTDGEVIRRAREFMLRSGSTTGDLAEMIGYAVTSLTLYLNGHYDKHHPREANTRNIRAALLAVVGRMEAMGSFVPRGTHHDTQDFRAVYASAINALEQGSAYLVDGPPGTQKTWTLRQVERAVNEGRPGSKAVYVYARAGHAPQSFLIECCAACGISRSGTIDQLLRKLRYFLYHQRTLFMVDEAHHLDHAGLEVLRQLLDLPPYFGVILAGSHDLTQRLSHWQMEQWRSRLRKTHYMNGLTAAEAAGMLTSELGAMPRELVDHTIESCRVDGSRNGEKFEYISARLLFWAIEDVRRRRVTHNDSAPLSAPLPTKTAGATSTPNHSTLKEMSA